MGVEATLVVLAKDNDLGDNATASFNLTMLTNNITTDISDQATLSSDTFAWTPQTDNEVTLE